MARKSIKKLLAMGLAALTLCTGTIPAAAAEIEPRTSKDTTWGFFVADSTTWHSLGVAREKENNTKVYVNWATGASAKALQGRVYGTSSSGTYPVDCGTDSPGKAHFYYIPRLGKYSLTNYVKENGYRYAKVEVCGTEGTGSVSGEWSPDSVGQYTVIS